MRQTSLEAYWRAAKGGSIGRMQREVLDALDRPRCNREVAEVTGIPINAVTPRMHELRSIGRVVEDSRRVDPGTGRKVIVWRRIDV